MTTNCFLLGYLFMMKSLTIPPTLFYQMHSLTGARSVFLGLSRERGDASPKLGQPCQALGNAEKLNVSGNIYTALCEWSTCM